LEDVEPLSHVTGLKELALDGNALTFNPNYIMHTVGALGALVQLDANAISGRLRRDADAWAARHLRVSASAQAKPYVSVQNRIVASASVAVVRPVQYPDAPDASVAADAPDAAGDDPDAATPRKDPSTADPRASESGDWTLRISPDPGSLEERRLPRGSFHDSSQDPWQFPVNVSLLETKPNPNNSLLMAFLGRS